MPITLPWSLYPKQDAFLLLPHLEALYGGAAFSGKTVVQLAGALQYVDIPGYSAVCFRRTYPELAAPDGFIDLSKRWLSGLDGVRYNEAQHAWRFASGAKLQFASIQHMKDVDRLERGPSYQYMAFDELTTFQKRMYTRMFSRLRKPKSGPLSRVPLRVRSGTNPGGEGHAWVKEHFPIGRDPATTPGRAFIPALPTDNLRADLASYRKSLEALDPVTRARMEDGDWEAQEKGALFDIAAFVIVTEAPICTQVVRFWDCAATTGESSAYTAGCKMGRAIDGRFVLLDMQRFKARPGERDALIRAQAEKDGRQVAVRIEQEGGSAGIKQAEDQVRMLAGFDVGVVKPIGDKPERAAPLARQASASNVVLVSNGSWIGPFLDEAQAFPGARFKDQIDAASGAFLHLTQFGPITAYSAERPPAPPAPGEVAQPAHAPAPRIAWAGANDPRRGRLFRR